MVTLVGLCFLFINVVLSLIVKLQTVSEHPIWYLCSFDSISLVEPSSHTGRWCHGSDVTLLAWTIVTIGSLFDLFSCGFWMEFKWFFTHSHVGWRTRQRYVWTLCNLFTNPVSSASSGSCCCFTALLAHFKPSHLHRFYLFLCPHISFLVCLCNQV